MQKVGVKLTCFEVLGTILNIEFGIRPNSIAKEYSIIQTAMGGVVDPKAYISQNMHKIDHVFIMSMQFWT